MLISPSSNHHSPNKQKDQKIGLPSKVAKAYYKHGLFLSSYPTCATSIAVCVVLLCCYPLLNIPLPGTIPTKIVLPYTNHNNNNNNQNSNRETNNNNNDDGKIIINNNNNLFKLSNFTTFDTTPPFPWARTEPFIYVQQIILRSTVSPWNDNMLLSDAFRGPLYEVFNLIELIRNHEEETRKTTLGHICLHVENVKRTNKNSLFPEYNCLILSPGNFWQQNSQEFNKDTNILNTIFSQQNLQKTKVSIADMLLGMNIRDTGLKRYPIRIRPRIIQYAITIIIKENDQLYLNSLKRRLIQKYSLHQNLENFKQENNNNVDDKQDKKNNNNNNDKKLMNNENDSIIYIYYPGEFNLMEFLPLFIAFISLFIYVYFSLRKIDIIKSRIILALTSVITIFSSLIMSLGFCFFFGLTISEQFKDIYPYLVIIVGLENVLVITKSVVSIDKTLDVKIRLAKGLMYEGWSITKNLLTEITILTIGLGTFVPIIQEFCIFAIVGLISDFFLQMLFFSTILSLDIKRYELTVDEVNHLTTTRNTTKTTTINGQITQNHIKYRPCITSTFYSGNINGTGVNSGNNSGTINRSRSHPKLTNLDLQQHHQQQQQHYEHHQQHQPIIRTDILKTNKKNNILADKKLPKRVRLFNFWARTRFFQRAFMAWMLVWITTIIYNSGFIEHFFLIEKNHTNLNKNLNNLRNKNFNENNHNQMNKIQENLNNETINSIINNLNDNTDDIKNLNNKKLETNHLDDKIKRNTDDDKNDIIKNENENQNEKDNIKLIKIKNNNNNNNKLLINNTEQIKRLKHRNYDTTIHLLNFHWSSILKQYNITINGKYVTILPSIKLSFVVPTEIAINLRNPFEKILPEYFQWKSFAAALDPIDFQDLDYNDDDDKENLVHNHNYHQNIPLFPKSPMEILLTSILLIISLFVMLYTLVVLYRCICSRNYAEWRTSWTSWNNNQHINNNNYDDTKTTTQKLLTCVTLQVEGHTHSIDCISIDNNLVASSCLEGHIKIWDSQNGELVANIQRLQEDFGETNFNQNSSPIWSLDYLDNLIAIGCADGSLEFWEGTTGKFKCKYKNDSIINDGVTHIKLTGDKVVVGRLSGHVDILRLGTYNRGVQIDYNFSSAYRRTHVRAGSTGSLGSFYQQNYNNQTTSQPTSASAEELKCFLECQHEGHQQPITCLAVSDGIIVTGSQDHTLKVFKLENTCLMYTLHGHFGPITCLFIDQWQNGTGGSGSEDGLLYIWDLIAGAGIYKIEAHNGAIISICCAPSYIITLGSDGRLCVWERFQLNLLNTIIVAHTYSNLLMFTSSLLVRAKPGTLIVLDVRTGETAGEAELDDSNLHICPKIMLSSGGSVVCDYGNQLRIVRFPLINSDKCE